jgi:hypothetical protein
MNEYYLFYSYQLTIKLCSIAFQVERDKMVVCQIFLEMHIFKDKLYRYFIGKSILDKLYGPTYEIKADTFL